MSAPLHPAPPYADWERALIDGSFEEVFSTLEAVVACLEEGRLSLADAVGCYELGVRLAERCERFLSEAELRVSRLEDAAARFSVFPESNLDPA